MPAFSDWFFRSLEKYCCHSDSSFWVFAILVPSDFLTFAAAFGVLFPSNDLALVSLRRPFEFFQLPFQVVNFTLFILLCKMLLDTNHIVIWNLKFEVTTWNCHHITFDELLLLPC